MDSITIKNTLPTEQKLKPHSKHHGMSKTSEWMIWHHIKDRCCNLKSKDRKNYGGRGIRVCERWKGSFKAFYDDMGPSLALNIQLIELMLIATTPAAIVKNA